MLTLVALVVSACGAATETDQRVPTPSKTVAPATADFPTETLPLTMTPADRTTEDLVRLSVERIQQIDGPDLRGYEAEDEWFSPGSHQFAAVIRIAGEQVAYFYDGDDLVLPWNDDDGTRRFTGLSKQKRHDKAWPDPWTRPGSAALKVYLEGNSIEGFDVQARVSRDKTVLDATLTASTDTEEVVVRWRVTVEERIRRREAGVRGVFDSARTAVPERPAAGTLGEGDRHMLTPGAASTVGLDAMWLGPEYRGLVPTETLEENEDGDVSYTVRYRHPGRVDCQTTEYCKGVTIETHRQDARVPDREPSTVEDLRLPDGRTVELIRQKLSWSIYLRTDTALVRIGVGHYEDDELQIVRDLVAVSPG